MVVIPGYPPGTVSKECIACMMFFENFELEAIREMEIYLHFSLKSQQTRPAD